MTEWLIDTLTMTGALMALVLLLRRPVARSFGAQAAYALWLLPALRFVMPPLALPAALAPTRWLAGLEVGVAQSSARAGEASTALRPASEAAGIVFAAEPPADFVFVPAEPESWMQIPWTSTLLMVWLAGALAFLVWRTWNYQMMRRQILADARAVASAGRVRIIESPLVAVPLAFGVFDKVVALPFGFLAKADSETSDFAIAHELEHHAGGDLIAIMALQPLFALHWFNPLAWASWRALRGDQEAACDARVMAGRDRAERARYGQLIASFAGHAPLALAAPMAGGLGGGKPIIQRLRALNQAETGPRRKLAARSLFALAIVAVPMTATVSYAARGQDEVTAATDLDVPLSPAPPAPPFVPGRIAAPLPPEAPSAPEAPASVRDIPPVPPAPPSVFDEVAASTERAVRRAEKQARHAGLNEVEIEAIVAKALANAPKVEELVSRDGKVKTLRIVHPAQDGVGEARREMVIDTRCPADTQGRSRARKQSKDGEHVVICSGPPQHIAQIVLSALEGARHEIAAQAGHDAPSRAGALAEIERELAEARAEVKRDLRADEI
ncbi:M56 family metallopeptidase [Novosphingobium sp. BW1]|uniref:M56 family metallopeptidase n=1 Tax=Novosphingobium sp. BW1 TaxID=2592621 RepID=UPI0011DEBA39|nr:M56 family metallopeptidase [Novosphingobium sp. BW1]TYC92847.1 antirepressor regulating drug resistance protein [Novosphingobium sp. BW1]